MGKPQSKTAEEKIIIAQNGPGNNAGATAATNQMDKKEVMEYYLIFITIFIVILIAHFYWKKVKKNYGIFVRRELQLPISTVPPRGEQYVSSFSPHQQQVIV